MSGRGSPGDATGPEFLPDLTSGVGELKRAGVRVLAAVALTVGFGATAACSGNTARPVPPSPGIDSVRPRTTAVSPSATASTGPGVTKPGIRLNVVPRTDGSFDVTEDVMLPEETNILQLQLPDSGEHLPGMMVATTPKVTNLNVTADNDPVPLEDTTVTAPEDLPLTTAASRIHLTYRLLGSAVRSNPSKPERAGAAIRPLTSTIEGTLPTDLTVTSGLLNAVCPLLIETRCATGDPPDLGIQPDIPAGKALVVVQLNLPRSP